MLIKLYRNLSVLCICLALCATSIAQSLYNGRLYYEESTGWAIGMNVGMSDMWGNVGTKSPIYHYDNNIYTNHFTFMGGMFARYSFHPAFGVRLQLNYGSLFATDAWNDQLAKSGKGGIDALDRALRAQDAKDVMFEGLALAEFSPLRLNPESKMAHRRGQPFIAAGIGIFHFTPYSTVGASNIYTPTYNLDLEGQGFGSGYPAQYSLWQPTIPLAIGYRWDIGQHLNLGIEYMYRLTFFSYLDGVSGKYVSQAAFNAHLSAEDATLAYEVANKSQYFYNQPADVAGSYRGNPSQKDAYSTLTITFYYKVLTHDKEWWRH